MSTDPTGRVVRNLFLLRQLENLLGRQATARLRELFDDIVAATARIDPTGVEATRFRRARAAKLLPEIEALTQQAFDELHAEVRTSLARIAAQQSRWAAGTLNEALGAIRIRIAPGTIGINKAKAILDTDPIVGEMLGDWFGDRGRAVFTKVRREIQLGVAADEGIGDLVRRIRGRAAGRGRYVGGVLSASTRETEAIVRTALTDISAKSHLETFKANDDITRGYRFVATLDSRTSLICASFDGTEWEYDEAGAPLPPLHTNCRSTITPVIDWEGLGIEPPAESTRASRESDGRRKPGLRSASSTYEDWLRGQTRSEQDKILGPRRAELFRAGKVGLRDLVRNDGRTVRLDELT